MEARRRLLVAESGCLRQQIAGDLSNLQPALAWVERGYSIFQSLRSFWPLVAGAIGFLVARKKGTWFRSAGKAWAYSRLIKKALNLWRSYAARNET
ncbi:MAG TPA: YqjK family protein [Candidatus Binatia bacterium]|jgi:hypothetical protein|nr:YqjK family protein [Candidatus Binatia bacterium]